MSMSETTATPSVEELQAKINQLQERSQRFEGMSKDLEVKLKAYDGVDLARLKADAEALAIVQRENASKNPEELKKWRDTESQKIRGEVQKQLDEADAERKLLRKQNHEMRVIDKAVEKIGDRFNTDTIDIVKNFISGVIDRDEKGEFIVKDEEGNARFHPQKPAQKMTLEDWAEELATKRPSLAKPTTVKGSGKAGEKTASGMAIGAERYLKMSAAERAQLPRETQQEMAAQVLNGMKIR